MRIWTEIRLQLPAVLPSIILVWVSSLLLLSLIVFVHHWRDTPIRFLTSDPAQIAGLPPHVGLLSNVGILFWSATATLCFFGAVVMPRPHGSESLRRYLFCSGALTALLLFDDLFLLHEVIFPIYLGIPDEVMLAIYSVLMLFYLLWFGRLVKQSDFLLFVMALGMFSLSIGIDLLSDDYLWEDGAKFIGIVSWFAYFAHVCAASLKGGFEPSKE